VALLSLLANDHRFRQAGLQAIHVHHGLYPEADTWAEHCRRFCTMLDIGLRIVEVTVPHDSGEGLEAAARHARYHAFRQVLGDGEILTTAHQREDQSETFLLRALRASGTDGLAAMRPWRSFARGWHWRPLLDISRTVLSAYATEQGLYWVDDPSNSDHDYDRNFLRHRIFPLLRERWPHVDTAFARSASLCAETSDLLQHEDARILTTLWNHSPHVLSVSALKALSAAQRARILRHWLSILGLPPLPAAGLVSIEVDLLTARADAQPVFAWNDAILQRWRDQLYADWRRSPLPPDWSTLWNGMTPLSLPDDSVLSLTAVRHGLQCMGFPAPLSVHTRRGGERIRLSGRKHSHALKQILQDLGIPPWQRNRLPLLSNVDGELLAVGDLIFSGEFEQWLQAHEMKLHWDMP
jgi:tRNA(Ile)-lysidine synthase